MQVAIAFLFLEGVGIKGMNSAGVMDELCALYYVLGRLSALK